MCDLLKADFVHLKVLIAPTFNLVLLGKYLACIEFAWHIQLINLSKANYYINHKQKMKIEIMPKLKLEELYAELASSFFLIPISFIQGT